MLLSTFSWEAEACLLHQEAAASHPKESQHCLSKGVNILPFPHLVPNCWGKKQVIGTCSVEVMVVQGRCLHVSVTWGTMGWLRGEPHEKHAKSWKVKNPRQSSLSLVLALVLTCSLSCFSMTHTGPCTHLFSLCSHMVFSSDMSHGH